MIRPMSVLNLKHHYRSLQGEQQRQQAVAASAIHRAAHEAFPELYMSSTPATVANSLTVCSSLTAAAEAAATASALHTLLNPLPQLDQGARAARKRKLQSQRCRKAENHTAAATAKRAKAEADQMAPQVNVAHVSLPAASMCTKPSGAAGWTHAASATCAAAQDSAFSGAGIAAHQAASAAGHYLQQPFDLQRQQLIQQQVSILQQLLQQSNSTPMAAAPAPSQFGSISQDAIEGNGVAMHSQSTMQRDANMRVAPKYTSRGGQDTQKACSNCHQLITKHYDGGRKVASGSSCPWPKCKADGNTQCYKRSCPCYRQTAATM
jgi:hypothetical protein